MEINRPSRTAQRVALRRAAHQFLDRPLILEDPFALRIIGPEAEIKTRAKANSRMAGSFRAFMATRSRYSEDGLAEAYARGVRQYVILGAGLDTFAWRNPWPDLRVFEVDFPATQRWKRQRVANVGMGEPASLTFAPVDFESQTLHDGLTAAGFRMDQPAYFSWLGVTMYLTREAFDVNVRLIASLPAGGGVTFDYAVDRSELGLFEKMALDHLSKRVASLGEPFQLFFRRAELAAFMHSIGFNDTEDLGAEELNSRYLSNREDRLKLRGGVGRLFRAVVSGAGSGAKR